MVAEIVRDGGKAIAMPANLAKRAEIERLFAQTTKAFGKLDILVNHAGIYEFSPLEAVTEELFHNLNVLGLILTTQEAAKHFGSAGGSVINISSLASIAAPPTSSVYSATKAAVDAVTKSLAKELGPRKIRVNAINPGIVETEGTQTGGIMESDFRKQVQAQTPLGRIGPDRRRRAGGWVLGFRGFIVDYRRDAGHRGRIPLKRLLARRAATPVVSTTRVLAAHKVASSCQDNESSPPTLTCEAGECVGASAQGPAVREVRLSDRRCQASDPR